MIPDFDPKTLTRHQKEVMFGVSLVNPYPASLAKDTNLKNDALAQLRLTEKIELLASLTQTGCMACMVISHNSVAKYLWDIMIDFLLLYSVIETFYGVSFDIDVKDGHLIWNIIVESLFAIDIILRFFTGYLDEDSLLPVTN